MTPPASRSKTSSPDEDARRATTWLEWLVVSVLTAMAVSLGYIRFSLLPKQDARDPIAFEFQNPLLHAREGDATLGFNIDDPAKETCVSVRKEGVVLRPFNGPDTLGVERGLRHQRAYLACSQRSVQGSASSCGSEPNKGEVLLYPLNDFGMPIATDVVPTRIHPRLMVWQDRELVVYQVDFIRYGQLSGQWSTFLSSEAPVTGLVHMSALQGETTIQTGYREVMRPIR